jgi:uncharacterized protein YvpB
MTFDSQEVVRLKKFTIYSALAVYIVIAARMAFYPSIPTAEPNWEESADRRILELYGTTAYDFMGSQALNAALPYGQEKSAPLQETAQKSAELLSGYNQPEIALSSGLIETEQDLEVDKSYDGIESIPPPIELLDVHQPEFEVRSYGSSMILEPSLPVFGAFDESIPIDDSEDAPEEGSFAEAAEFARQQAASAIFWENSESFIWDNATELPEKANHEVEIMLQLPELPRGCEVTSLAMLLSSSGIKVDKLELAEKIGKDETPLKRIDGEIHYGDPRKGFVGSMDDLLQDGYGVYHKPVFDLLSEYAPEGALDLTGCEFEDVLHFLASGPVWVITNSWFQELPESQFVTWQTSEGPVKVTYREHSVLLTGYDPDRVYFNDPQGIASYALLQPFREAWEQMGRQAVTIAG